MFTFFLHPYIHCEKLCINKSKYILPAIVALENKLEIKNINLIKNVRAILNISGE